MPARMHRRLWPGRHGLAFHENARVIQQASDTIHCKRQRQDVPDKGRAVDGMNAMCTLSVEMLSFPALLEDPLIRMMMASDGVSAGELHALMSRMRDVVAARGEAGQHVLRLQTVD